MWPPHEPISNDPITRDLTSGSGSVRRVGSGERPRSHDDGRYQALAQPSGLRIGDAERDQVASALHEHFALGRLTREELDERLDAALVAKTVGDLRPITADLPAVKTESPRSSTSGTNERRSRRRRQRSRGVGGAPAATAFAALPMWMFLIVLFVISSGRAFFLLLPILVFGWFIMVMRRFAFAEDAWHVQQPHWQHGHHHWSRHAHHHWGQRGSDYWSQRGHYMR